MKTERSTEKLKARILRDSQQFKVNEVCACGRKAHPLGGVVPVGEEISVAYIWECPKCGRYFTPIDD